MVVASEWGEGEMSCLTGIAFQLCKFRKSSEDWLHNNVHIFNTTELYA